MIRKIISAFVLFVSLAVTAGFLVSAYSGHVPASECRYAPLLAMTFPGWLAAMCVVLVADAIWWRRILVAPLLAFLVCLPQVLDYFPLHVFRPGSGDGATFTLMTYNVMHMTDQDSSLSLSCNRQLEYVLGCSADVVCLQEAEYLQPGPTNFITADQLADMQRDYPYVFVNTEQFAFLSKIRATPIPVDFPAKEFRSGNVTAWRLYIGDEVVNVFNVHLRSFSFPMDQREMFREMTTPENKVKRSQLSELRHVMLPRLMEVTLDHEKQIKILQRILRKYGGENTIVCGDFNGPENSYPIYVLEKECGFKQVYPQVGFGPMVSYNANHFFFRIDHVLYRGKIKPLSMERGDIKASDHYPLTVTFELLK